MERNWKDVNDELPDMSNRYWGYIEDINDFGKSYYQDNVYYDKEENIWSSFIIKNQGGRVSHWTELLERPPNRRDKINRIVERIK